MTQHSVPDYALITEELIARLGNEASLASEEIVVGFTEKRGHPIKEKRAIPGPFRAVIRSEGGKTVEFGTGPGLAVEQRMLADDMVTMLNRELHHDGCWLFSFCNPMALPMVLMADQGVQYGRFVILWMDADGDVQFPIECDRPFENYLLEGPNALADKCEKAWKFWRHYMRTVLDPQPGELYRKALGEKAPSSVH